MIERYSLSPVRDIWTLEKQYERWLKIEIAVVEAFEEKGIAPEGTAKKIREKAKINVERILEIEEEVDHDVIAFIKGVTENMGDEARYFHMGLTSSDVVDTAWAIGMKEATKMILEELKSFIKSLENISLKHKKTLTVGRSHGVHAEPTSFGLKMLTFLAEMKRNYTRLKRAYEGIKVGKLSGAVGNYANISPEIEKLALNKLGLRPTEISTQIVPRDIHAELFSVFALIGSGLDRLATEIRHLQKTEVLELQEPFKKGQRGSSAMPHKKNPIICERLSGMARLLRSYTIPAYENIVLWHERDISHSSVERVNIPDATMIMFYMLEKSIYLIDNLVVDKERMLETFKRSYNLVYSQRVLLGLIGKGLSREDSYKIVQENALKAWEEKKDFKLFINSDKRITDHMSEKEIDELFSNEYFLKNVDEVYKRFF
ncbi:adenylosuccinate lyase [Geotoga petraea]|jgi:adenylosuccinate lyase|uniref:Adenylosuccinate lyase n=1 Tax=Geotoga petraea TaxID=28234 RepID=A0A1G6IAP4_9BACT|nr:adenylosuccinate lyase [Geotoga petraea]MDK2945593.1 adenylosuccinate lyase [Geotoga sp.]SDC03597.1 Adenylosuccinate lyase [Geotoga petraea]